MSDLITLMPKTERMVLESKLDKLNSELKIIKEQWKKPLTESEWWQKFGHCDHICEVADAMEREGYITTNKP